MDLAQYIDHTILKPEAKPEDVIKLCHEADKYKFKAVCINPVYVELAKKTLKPNGSKVATVIGFPLGANTTHIKIKEAHEAVENGADEIDMVMCIGLFKSGDHHKVGADIKDVVKASAGRIVKVILETGFLTPDETKLASKLSMDSGAGFVKTSTGFGPRGASVEDIRIMKDAVGNSCGIKASGGIRDLKFMKELINAGATRIGTSSGIKIMEEQKS